MTTTHTGDGAAAENLSQPLYGAGMGQAVIRFFKKYTRFKGYASRSEYWWAALFQFIVGAVVSAPYYLSITGREITAALLVAGSTAMLVWALATVIPMLALTWRRLHDAGLPGPLYFLTFIPGAGPFILVVLLVLPTNPENHQQIWADPAHDPNTARD